MRLPNVLRTTFSSLENRNYRWFWLSNLASHAGMNMWMIAGGWLVHELTDSNLALGFAFASFGAPMFLLALWGGAIVDRVDKRNILIITQAIIAIIILICAVLITTGVIQLWHLYVISFVNGVVFAFNQPARQAIIPQLVERSQIMNAVSLGAGAMNMTRIVGPALAGVLIGIIGTDGVYFVISAFNILSFALLFSVSPLGKPSRASQTTVRVDIREGLSYVRHNPIILSLLTVAFVPVVFGMTYQVLMPVFASDVLNVGASGLGLLLAMAGIGALAGTMVIASLGDFRHKGWLLLGAPAFFGAFLILFAQSGIYSLALFAMLGVGAANVAYMTSNITLIQMHVDDRLRGRVMSIYMVNVSLMPIASLGTAAVAESLGAPFAITVGGVIIIVFILAMVIFRSSLRNL